MNNNKLHHRSADAVKREGVNPTDDETKGNDPRPLTFQFFFSNLSFLATRCFSRGTELTQSFDEAIAKVHRNHRSPAYNIHTTLSFKQTLAWIDMRRS